jgi:hypothetical protein
VIRSTSLRVRLALLGLALVLVPIVVLLGVAVGLVSGALVLALHGTGAFLEALGAAAALMKAPEGRSTVAAGRIT